MKTSPLLLQGKLNPQLVVLMCFLSSFGNVKAQVFADYPAAYPNAIEKGDFNGDGVVDLVTVSFDDPRISILIGNPDGSFKPTQFISIGKYNFDVAVGDINGDGKADIVASSCISKSTSPGCAGANNQAVALLLGKGDGTFQSPSFLQMQFGNIALADLNGDHVLDLIVAGGNSIVVYLGTGKGTFTQKAAVPLASFSDTRLVVADFNHDAKLDVAVYLYTGAISVLLGAGDGSLRPAVNTQVTGTGQLGPSFAAGDFNGDGIMDLAVSAGSFNGTIRIFLGKGDGSLQYGGGANLAYSNLRAPAESVGALAFAVGDMNGDGKLDLVVGVGSSNINPEFGVLFGNGDATFGSLIPFGFAQYIAGFSTGIVLADFNGDGRLDIAVADTIGPQQNQPNFVRPEEVAVYLNTNFTTISYVFNVANLPLSLSSSGLSPGEIVVISGVNLGPSQLKSSDVTASGFVSTMLDKTQVLFDGVAAPLIYARNDQVCAVVPYEVFTHDHTIVQVEYAGFKSNALTFPIVPAVPALFIAGPNQVFALNQDGTQNSPANPAARGSIVSLFATGEGQTSPGGLDGKLGNLPLAQPLLPVTVLIFGEAAEILYAGGMPFAVAGLMLIDIRVPSDLFAGRLPILLKVGAFSSPVGLTIATQ